MGNVSVDALLLREKLSTEVFISAQPASSQIRKVTECVLSQIKYFTSEPHEWPKMYVADSPIEPDLLLPSRRSLGHWWPVSLSHIFDSLQYPNSLELQREKYDIRVERGTTNNIVGAPHTVSPCS